MKYKQLGRNDKFPEKISDTWTRGTPVPEWISDNAKITFIDGNGNIVIEIRDNTSGGYDIIRENGVDILVRTSTQDSIICLSPDNMIISLKKEQIELLYEEDN